MTKPEKETRYYEDGSIESEEWYLNNNLHREDEPAYIHYRKDGSVKREFWHLNNKFHRKDGPAYIRYRKDGSVAEEAWYLNGKRLFKGSFKSLEQIKEMKALRLFTPVDIAKMRCEVINE